MTAGRRLVSRLIGAGPATNRAPDDFYATVDPWPIVALLDSESFDGAIWEPACGQGHISRVLKANGHRVISTDLVRRGYGRGGIDFLVQHHSRAPHIVTNPPFGIEGAFTLKALDLTRPHSGKVALLVKLTFLESWDRRPLFAWPFACCYAFSKRVTTLRGGKPLKGKGRGMMAFAWMVWDWQLPRKAEPVIRFLP